MAAPSFLQLRRQMQLIEATRGLHAPLHFARAQAAARGLPVVPCQTDTSGRRSAGGSAGAGWRVFAKPGAGLFSTFEPGDQLLGAAELPARLQLFGTRSAVTNWPTPRTAATGSFVLCDDDARTRPRALIVS
jgi:hypothetical protein